MTTALVIKPTTGHLALPETVTVPAIIGNAGAQATRRFVEFFTVTIRNPNTRAAYGRAVGEFFAWCDAHGLSNLRAVEPIHVAAYIEQLTRDYPASTVKLRLAAIRMLFDWLVVGQVMPHNPATAVRGPKLVIKRGKTPVLRPEDARLLLDSITTETIVGLRDRALIGVMVYTFARVSAAITMRVENYYPIGKRWWIRLAEKGGKHHEMPAHHRLEAYLDAYIRCAGLAEEPKSVLFRTSRGRTTTLTDNPMTRTDALRMIKRRANDAGIGTPITCHTFRATGITAYLENGGTLEKAQMMAAHESPRTTKLYDRTADQITLDEVERIAI